LGSSGAEEMSVFHAVVAVKGRKPLRLALSPRLMPAQLGPAVDVVTVMGAELCFEASAVDVAVMVTEFAPVLAGVKMTGVPDVTAVASFSVPVAMGLMEKFTVLANAPVPVTVGVQEAVWVVVMVDGLQARETAVMVGAAGAVMVIFAEPSFVVSALDVALTVS
jgi:hypothetical protein